MGSEALIGLLSGFTAFYDSFIQRLWINPQIGPWQIDYENVIRDLISRQLNLPGGLPQPI
jgi:hypothetical protein